MVKGLYLWGSVGIGKTYLMNIFYHSLPFPQKKRQHFHEFMQAIHYKLKQLQGHKNPLSLIAERMQGQVLCFDEFFVTDIGDAMLLRGLLDHLFKQGVTLIATSNCHPDVLYANGLQRQLFLPAIQLLKEHCQVIEMVSQQDYRLRVLPQGSVYFYPLTLANEQRLAMLFSQVAPGVECQASELFIEGRMIKTKAQGANVVWFDFAVLCSIPRSQLDYLAIAQAFTTVIISGVPQISPRDINTITYFIYLVDIFYENHINLILSAATPLTGIYPEGAKFFEFQRTQSRLIEMQSADYLTF